jgi:CheY-like chemotaxis protein
LARKILLADDSVTAQNMGRKILTDAGYEVVTVNNGSAALKKILEQKPDLIVLDVYMPGYSGLEVCQRIKENKETSRIPVLLTVGKLEPFKPEEARRARADAFVVKPFEASELLAALTKLEGKIVPQAEPYKPGRFAKAAAAVEADDRAEDDASWKARLRIPTGKKRDPEPDVDYAATQGKGFRDLRAEETGKKSRAKGKETEDTFERPIPAGLPSDITPEEIAAITAAAARLNGAAPAAETTAPEPVLAAPVEIEATPAAAEEPAPVTFASAPEIQSSEVQNEIQSAVLDVQIAPAEPATGAQAEKIESVVEQAVAVPQQVPAPAEAVAAAPVEVAAAQPAQLESLPTLEAQQAEPQVVAPSTEMPVVAESTAPEAVPSAPPAEVVAAPVAATPETPAPAVVAPSADDEVMAALQSLMPAAENMSPLSSGTNGSGKSHEASFSLLNMTAQVDAATVKAHIAGPRWIAEEVALGAGEATLSLEREMEQAYAAVAAGEPPRASAEASAAVTQPESVAAVAEPLPEVPPARTPQPEGAEEPAVYAMASAAGAGDVAPVAAGVQLVLQEAAIIESVQPRPEAEVVTSVASSAPVDAPQSITEIESPQAASAPPAALPDHQTPKARIPEIRILETEIAEGAEDMVANWKNIRDSIAGAAPKRAPSKEDVPVEPVKAETEPSAAAPHDTAPAGAADAKAIASIVDSVLAELRPRIVEEIAKKLSGETKKD